jgi:hypothetical protein
MVQTPSWDADQEGLSLLWNSNVQYRVRKTLQLDPILNQKFDEIRPTFRKNISPPSSGSNSKPSTEQVGLEVTLWTCIREVLGSNIGRDTYPEFFHGFPQYLQINAGILPILNYDGFLPSPFQFIIHLS